MPVLFSFLIGCQRNEEKYRVPAFGFAKGEWRKINTLIEEKGRGKIVILIEFSLGSQVIISSNQSFFVCTFSQVSKRYLLSIIFSKTTGITE